MVVLEACPRPAVSYLSDGRRANVELASDCSVPHILSKQFSDYRNIGLGQFGIPFLTSATKQISLNSLFHIFCVRTLAQVIRVNTWRAIARMQDLTYWPLTSFKEQGIFSRARCLAIHLKIAVTVVIFRRSPPPTTFGFLDIAPEPQGRLADNFFHYIWITVLVPTHVMFNAPSASIKRSITTIKRTFLWNHNSFNYNR